eukprot:scaffold1813_cov129-Isochrysis_galbana.AAC.10
MGMWRACYAKIREIFFPLPAPPACCPRTRVKQLNGGGGKCRKRASASAESATPSCLPSGVTQSSESRSSLSLSVSNKTGSGSETEKDESESDSLAQSRSAARPQPQQSRLQFAQLRSSFVGRRVLVPRDMWPNEPCSGKGWPGLVRSVSREHVVRVEVDQHRYAFPLDVVQGWAKLCKVGGMLHVAVSWSVKAVLKPLSAILMIAHPYTVWFIRLRCDSFLAGALGSKTVVTDWLSGIFTEAIEVRHNFGSPCCPALFHAGVSATRGCP